jgi:transcription elongation GreA/GreB family factor
MPAYTDYPQRSGRSPSSRRSRALLESTVGDTTRLRGPRGEEELEIVAVEYAAKTQNEPG